MTLFKGADTNIVRQSRLKINKNSKSKFIGIALSLLNAYRVTFSHLMGKTVPQARSSDAEGTITIMAEMCIA